MPSFDGFMKMIEGNKATQQCGYTSQPVGMQIITEYKDSEVDLVLAALERMTQHLTAAVVSNDVAFQQKARLQLACIKRCRMCPMQPKKGSEDMHMSNFVPGSSSTMRVLHYWVCGTSAGGLRRWP